MILGRLTSFEIVSGFTKLFRNKIAKRPVLVNLEVTKRCMARCDFCNYWREEPVDELKDYRPVIKMLKPLIISLTGGEPMLRNDIYDICLDIKKMPGFTYVLMITTGWNLTVDNATRLWMDCGLDQLSISLDFPDERHDKKRGLSGLYKKIEGNIPKLQSRGIDNIILDTVITNENLHEATNLVKLANDWGVKISFSCYTSMKTGNYSYYIDESETGTVRDVIGGLLELKKKFRNIVNSDYYLERIPEYFENGRINGCLAGEVWLQVTPDGYLKPCSEMPIVCHYTEYDGDMGEYNKGCSTCWFNCRGENQAPINWSRFVDLFGRW